MTLSDEEARRRGTQKTVLERRAPPTFDVLIEIQNRDRFAVHLDVAASVDALLRGYPLPPEIRMRDESGFHVEKPAVALRTYQNQQGQQGYRRQAAELGVNSSVPDHGEQFAPPPSRYPSEAAIDAPRSAMQTVRIYPYGVARNRLLQATKRLRVPAVVANDPGQADVLLTLRSYYRKRQRTIVDAENRGVYPSPPARDLYFVTKGQPRRPLLAEFLEWVLLEGQKYVAEMGYIAVGPDRIAAGLAVFRSGAERR